LQPCVWLPEIVVANLPNLLLYAPEFAVFIFSQLCSKAAPAARCLGTFVHESGSKSRFQAIPLERPEITAHCSFIKNYTNRWNGDGKRKN